MFEKPIRDTYEVKVYTLQSQCTTLNAKTCRQCANEYESIFLETKSGGDQRRAINYTRPDKTHAHRYRRAKLSRPLPIR